MSLEALSTELQQNILGYLDFISLLNTRNASTTWRDRVNTSLSKANIILPARAKLLELYLELHLYPSLLYPSDEEPFSGEEYISTLRSQIATCAPKSNLCIPAEFEHWILEWPQCAPLSFAWFVETYGYDDGSLGSKDARTRLSYASCDEDAEPVGIYVGYHGCTIYSTLFFEEGKESDGVVWTGDICEMEETESWDVDEHTAGSWTGYLRREIDMRKNR